MTLRMADSVTAEALPLGMDAYAGYINGRYANVIKIASRHHGVPIVAISVVLTNAGDCLDIENGDARPGQAPTFVEERAAAAVWRPILYGSIEDAMPSIKAALEGAGLLRSEYRLLSAHYGQGAHICGPSTCGSPIQVDGTQWIDHGGWDESLLSDAFFAPVPVPAPPVYGPTYPEDAMQAAHVQVQIRGGHGHCKSPFPTILSVVVDDIDPSTAGRYVVVPVFVGPAADGELVFGPGGDGPAPDANYGFTVWGVPAS